MYSLKILSVLALTAIASALNAPAVEIQPNVQYAGEKTLESSQYGVSFMLPAGWAGVLPADGEFLVMKSQGFEGYIFTGIRKMTVAEAQQSMGQEMALGDGIIFHPKGRVRVREAVLEAEYRISGSQSPLVGHIRTIVGKYGWGLFFMAASAARDVSKMESALSKISGSVTLSEPKNPTLPPPSAGSSPWVEHLTGRKLSHFFTRSGYTEEVYIWLCPSGHFYRSFNSGGFGGGASGAFQSKNAGGWSVSGDLDAGMLLLAYNDGSKARYTLTHEGTKIFLNGKRFFRETADCN